MPRKIKANEESKELTKVKKLVPDTSVIIEGIISKEVAKDDLKLKTILIHEAVVSELENQANKGREVGILGLKEIKKLNELSEDEGFKVEFTGKRPGEFEIKHAKSGEIDSLIRALAAEEKATLMTADRVQAFVAESKNIDVVLYEFEEDDEGEIPVARFFDEETMSIHLKEECIPNAKKGEPGGWGYVKIEDEPLSKEEMEEISNDIVEMAHVRDDSFVEIERKGSTIIQLANYRIVITRPPFSDGYEITAVRPVAHLTLDDYDLSDKLLTRLEEQAEGILISGAPGHGKTTFAQALAENYLDQDKVVKTVEAPRDLVLSDEIAQYAISHGSSQEVHDILLLSRPDYTIFDEMRNTSDFRLFSDMRLSGVGMIGVVHATQTIDAVQRFLGRVELGVIPHIIDTVIFIRDGGVNKVYALEMQVKVPAGMTEADLARPIVVINDFETGNAEFEIYSYGEETVVIPVSEQATSSPMFELARDTIINYFQNYTDVIDVEVQSQDRATVYVPHGAKKKLIGKGGERIEKMERELNIGIDVRETNEDKVRSESIDYRADIGQNNVVLQLDESLANDDVDIYVDGEFLMSATVSKKGQIKITRSNKLGKILADAVQNHDRLELKK